MIDSSPGDDGGYKSVTLDVKGDSVYSKLKWEAGVHCVQRVPATESQGCVHTFTATVTIMPECDKVDIKIDPKDIEMSTMRSGGAGGRTSIRLRRRWICFTSRRLEFDWNSNQMYAGTKSAEKQGLLECF